MGGNNVKSSPVERLKHASKPMAASPLVEILSDRRVLIENYAGIAEYFPERITVSVCYGMLVITGKQLMLSCMCKERLVVTGSILSVTLERRS